MESLWETVGRIDPLWNESDFSVWEIPPAKAARPESRPRTWSRLFGRKDSLQRPRSGSGFLFPVTCNLFPDFLCVEFAESSICGFSRLAHGERIDAMAARLFHRGPDSGGKFQLPHIALAIRRLSIIDLETGNQPLSNETGDITLVFNGEIYNYRELCEGLLDRGHHFQTHSDGEAIIHLYEEQGPDCLRELNGMFAIALWDHRAKRLLLARDRAGEKPLYYWRDGQTLVFGSEIKALLEYPGISRAIDPTALTHYFFYGHFPSPRSVYAEIKKLPAAHRMVVEGGNIHIDAYWRPQDYLRPPDSPR